MSYMKCKTTYCLDKNLEVAARLMHQGQITVENSPCKDAPKTWHSNATRCRHKALVAECIPRDSCLLLHLYHIRGFCSGLVLKRVDTAIHHQRMESQTNLNCFIQRMRKKPFFFHLTSESIARSPIIRQDTWALICSAVFFRTKTSGKKRQHYRFFTDKKWHNVQYFTTREMWAKAPFKKNSSPLWLICTR